MSSSMSSSMSEKILPGPFNFVLLYVTDPAASARFYSEALGAKIVEQHEGFAMLPLREGVMLGLWARKTVEPAPEAAPGGSELAFGAASAADVHAICADWTRRGVRIAQPVSQKDFGTTFVGLDPDGHRLRVVAPPAA